MTITDERRAFLRECGRKGGLVRAQSFSIEFQRNARAHVSHESNVANGRKGAAVTLQKYGRAALVEKVRRYRLAHPSNLERIVADALTLIGATGYEREAYLLPDTDACLTGDFVFFPERKVIYADGRTWHTNGHPLHGEARADRDAHNDALLQSEGWQVLRLTQAEIEEYDRTASEGIRGNEALLRKLREFLWG